jgi:hypothetical protein
VLVDLLVTPTEPTSPRGLYVALAACHVIAMTSAVSNPIVYGWLNSNIRREFVHLLPARCACAAYRRSSNDRAKATTIGELMSHCNLIVYLKMAVFRFVAPCRLV